MARTLSGSVPWALPPPGLGNGNSPVCAAWIALNSRSSKYWIRFARTGIWASMTMTISSSGRRRASSSGSKELSEPAPVTASLEQGQGRLTAAHPRQRI